jgi:hypothetical protein
MAFEDFDEKQCVCDFLDALGDVKAAFVSMVDSAITVLTLAKVAIALWPEDPADRLRVLGLQAELQVLETIVAPISTPFVILQAYFNQYGDCPGIASIGTTLTDVRDIILGPFEEQEAEINAIIESLNVEGTKIERLEDLIGQLQSVKDAIELCGQI